jgi:hypothetical protein
VPTFLWFAQSGLAFILRDVYLLYATALFYVEYAANFSLRHYFARRGGSCATIHRETEPVHWHQVSTSTSLFSPTFLFGDIAEKDRFTLPSFEAQLLFSFLSFWLAHALLWRRSASCTHILWMLFYLIFVSFGLYYNAVADALDLTLGAALGSAIGFSKAYFFKFYLYPYIPLLLRRTPLKRLGYMDYVIPFWTLQHASLL